LTYNGGGQEGRIAISFYSGVDYVVWESDPGSVPADGNWHALMVAVDTNHAAGAKILTAYLGDVPIAGSWTTDTQGAFFNSFSAIRTAMPEDPGDGVPPKCDMADVRVMPGVFVDFGDTPTRRLFIGVDGKPVDPAIATTALGAPCVLFSGDAPTFSTNQGTGGAFTLAGTLTDASTSPSD
jgi:hypothetical protein